jgi:hypothetical protein
VTPGREPKTPSAPRASGAALDSPELRPDPPTAYYRLRCTCCKWPTKDFLPTSMRRHDPTDVPCDYPLNCRKCGGKCQGIVKVVGLVHDSQGQMALSAAACILGGPILLDLHLLLGLDPRGGLALAGKIVGAIMLLAGLYVGGVALVTTFWTWRKLRRHGELDLIRWSGIRLARYFVLLLTSLLAALGLGHLANASDPGAYQGAAVGVLAAIAITLLLGDQRVPDLD